MFVRWYPNIIVGTAMDDSLKDEIKVTLIATGLNNGSLRKKDSIMDDFQRNVPKFSASDSTSTPRTERRTPSSFSSSVSDDDSIFSRKLRPGMSNIDVPSFFKPGK